MGRECKKGVLTTRLQLNALEGLLGTLLACKKKETIENKWVTRHFCCDIFRCVPVYLVAIQRRHSTSTYCNPNVNVCARRLWQIWKEYGKVWCSYLVRRRRVRHRAVVDAHHVRFRRVQRVHLDVFGHSSELGGNERKICSKLPTDSNVSHARIIPITHCVDYLTADWIAECWAQLSDLEPTTSTTHIRPRSLRDFERARPAPHCNNPLLIVSRGVLLWLQR